MLIKHSLPEIDPGIPAAAWMLSETGRQRCILLAQRVAEYTPDMAICSQEPKASETGRLLAGKLCLPWAVAPNLHEHERPTPGLAARDVFESAVESLFAHPEELVFGAESAQQAQERFTKAVEAVCANHPAKNLAIVAHGTVISLFVAHKTGLDAFSFWKRLGLPSVVVLSLPDFKLEKVIENVC